MYWQEFDMKTTNYNKISKELVNSFNEEITFELTKRLEDEYYASPLWWIKRLAFANHLSN